MSRTVRFSSYRYFKLMYIVAGILLSNAAICETVDQIQIAPRLTQSIEIKENMKMNQRSTRNAQRDFEISAKRNTSCKRWYHKFILYRLLNRMQSLLCCPWRVFSVWTLFNLLIECSTSVLCRTFIINSDCDVIYK